MKTKHHLITAALSLCCTSVVFGQNDFGLWTSLGAEKHINKKLSIDADVEMRWEDNLRQVSRWDFSLGASYKVKKWLKTGTGYSFIHSYNPQEMKVKYKEDDDGNLALDNEGNPRLNGYNVDHAFWRNKHRAWFDATGKADCGRFTFSLRERYLFTHYNEAECLRDKYRTPVQPGYTGETYTCNGQEFISFTPHETDFKARKNRHMLRSRLQVEYNIKGLPLNPYASYEITNDLGNGFAYDKSRVQAGLDWKIKKKHTVSLGYLFQTGPDDDEGEGGLHAIRLSYKIKL